MPIRDSPRDMRTLLFSLISLAACGTAEPPQAPGTDAVPAVTTVTPTPSGEFLVDAQRRLVLRSGTEERVLAEAIAGGVALSADQRTAAWARLIAGGPEGAVVLASLPEAEPRTLVEGVVDRVALSPDGAYAAYVRGGEVPRIELVATAGGEPRVLTNADVVRVPGQAPEGFVPPPHRDPPRFEGDELVWAAADGEHRVRWR